MKAVILAGGLGTRISEETDIKPKPMIEIGGKPIIWHIMKLYSYHGINEFIICCGYKGYLIKEYFANYFIHVSDVTFDLNNNSMVTNIKRGEPWKVTLVDTGVNTLTGGRIKLIEKYVKDSGDFCLTYGDGLSNVNIQKLVKFHKEKNPVATLTAVFPPGRFGALDIENNMVKKFKEKPDGDNSMINGGFFVLSQKVFKYLSDEDCSWERQPLEKIASEKKLAAFPHHDFWQPMDTLRDKRYLENLWSQNKSPWKVWK